MPITVCVRMLYVWVCVQACVKSNSLIPCCCPLGQHPTNTKQGGLCIAQSMTPGWRVLRSTLKPCMGEDRKIDVASCRKCKSSIKVWVKKKKVPEENLNLIVKRTKHTLQKKPSNPMYVVALMLMLARKQPSINLIHWILVVLGHSGQVFAKIFVLRQVP